jgi:hypothetical protein
MLHKVAWGSLFLKNNFKDIYEKNNFIWGLRILNGIQSAFCHPKLPNGRGSLYLAFKAALLLTPD